jgi:hypothetical protein
MIHFVGGAFQRTPRTGHGDQRSHPNLDIMYLDIEINCARMQSWEARVPSPVEEDTDDR